MSRKLWIALLSLAAVALTSTAWSLRDEYDAARITTGRVAKETCSCIHVGNRTLDACLADLPDANHVEVAQTSTQVRASILFGAVSSEAAYEDGFGCQLRD